MILYFSGTGNSEYAAERIAAETGDSILSLNELIKDGDHSPLSSDAPWVIVTPTYAWQMPLIVKDWLLSTPLKGNDRAYFVLTCGDSVGNAAAHAKDLCRAKKLSFQGLYPVVMPENYIALFNAPEEETARKQVLAAGPSIALAAGKIRRGEKFPAKNSPAGFILSSAVNPLFYKTVVHDRAFTVSSSCTSCGVCESLCPLNNISLKDGKPVWLGNCTHCMACICHCPEKAIEYGRASVGKPRYTCPPV